MDRQVEGLELIHEGHRTRLKWHQLRRRMIDPLFSADVMADGFKLGASMELDLRIRGDGGFVVLHDDVLEGETTGQGEIAKLSRKEMQSAQFPDGRRLTYTEELAQMLSTAHPDALLQFDMKDHLSAIGARGVAHLAEYFANPPCSIIVSGEDLALIVAVREQLPRLLRGIDPTDKLAAIFKAEGLKAVEADLIADLKGPTAPDTVYLYWELVLEVANRGLDLIALCQAHGAKVDAWTYTLKIPDAGFSEDEWRDFSALMALKPDQITTDEAPATERAWLARMSED